MPPNDAGDPFEVRLTRQAEKDLRPLRAHLERVLRAIDALATDPHKGHTLTGSLHGARSLEFTLPGGAHRAAYVVVVDGRVCIVFAIGAHEGFYSTAERRYRALLNSGELRALA